MSVGNRLHVVALALLACCLSRHAEATIVFGNINTPSDVDNAASQFAVGYVNVSQPNIFLAQGFTSGSSRLVVRSITLGLAADTSISSSVVQIFSNQVVSGSNFPNAAVATFALSGTSAILDLEPYTYTGSYTLSASTPYWVVVSDSAVPNSSFNYYETESEDTPTGSFGYTYLATRRTLDGGSTWNNFSAGSGLSLSVVAVPEPSTYALAAAGLGIAGLVRARRRKAAV